MSRFSVELEFSAGVVFSAGRLVKKILDRGVAATVKADQPGGSHHAVVTEADDRSQEYILTALRQRFSQVHFIAEEECTGPDLIANVNLEQVHAPGLVCIVDALDGTASAYRRRWDWSVCVNFMKDGLHRGGAIFAPEVRGGLAIVGERGVGAALSEGGLEQPETPVFVSQEHAVGKSTVLFGIDVLKRRELRKFSFLVANAVETATVAGSCALGVATVAAGRAEAIVQPHQWPWDWASAFLIEAAGGKVQFYHYRQGTIVPVAVPDLPSYNRINRKTEGGLGFIAGVPETVDWLFHELKQNWNT